MRFLDLNNTGSGGFSESGDGVTGWVYTPIGNATDPTESACTGLPTYYLPAGQDGAFVAKFVESAGNRWPAIQFNDTPSPVNNINPSARSGIENYDGNLYSFVNGGSFSNLGARPAYPFWCKLERVGAVANLYVSSDGVSYTLIGSVATPTGDAWPGTTGDSPSNPQEVGPFFIEGPGWAPYP